jgi:hypothetical protein
VLSRIEAQAFAKGRPQTVQPVTWTRAAAEQTAPAFSVENLIEGKTNIGWSIEKPRTGKADVSASFEAESGAASAGLPDHHAQQPFQKKQPISAGFVCLITSSKNPVSLPDSFAPFWRWCPIAAAPINGPSWQLIIVPSRRSLERSQTHR